MGISNKNAQKLGQTTNNHGLSSGTLGEFRG